MAVEDEDDLPPAPKVKKPPPPPRPGEDIFTGWIDTIESFRHPLLTMGVTISAEQHLPKGRVRFTVKLDEATLQRIQFLWGPDLHWDLENSGYYKKGRDR